MHILSSFISKFYKFLLWFHPKFLWSADICTVKDVESINCIQYTIFYSNYDDSAPSHSYALKLKSLEIAFGDEQINANANFPKISNVGFYTLMGWSQTDIRNLRRGLTWFG